MSALLNGFQQILRPFSQSTSGTTATKPKPAATATGPLSPQFDASKSKFKRNLSAARKESRELGEGFYASKIVMTAANIDADATFYGYHTDKPETMSINKKLPNNRLDAAVFMNVSGHDWREDTTLTQAQKQKLLADRAKDNEYHVELTRPDGTKETMTGIKANGALSTEIDISIQNMKPGTYTLEAWPEHSAGVAGYLEGRQVKITYAPHGDAFGS